MQMKPHTTHTALRTILENAAHYDWSVQGMGMFRLYLSREVRVHVWDKRFAVEDVTMVHDHPFDFESTVMWGRLMDKVYIIKPGFPVNYMKQRIVCGEGAHTDSAPEGVHLQLQSAELYKTGARYSHVHSDLHETEPADGTVTLVVRRFLADEEHANVFYPVGHKFVSAEPRPATVGEVYQMSEKALEMYESDG